ELEEPLGCLLAGSTDYSGCRGLRRHGFRLDHDQFAALVLGHSAPRLVNHNVLYAPLPRAGARGGFRYMRTALRSTPSLTATAKMTTVAQAPAPDAEDRP